MNKYLEKIAANRGKEFLQGKGISFGDSRLGGASNASINASHFNTAPSALFNTGDKITTPGRSGFLGLGKKPSTTINAGVTKATGDTLASGKTLGQRLAGYKTLKATQASTTKPGILSKALGFVKKNPLLAAGGALAGGLALGGKIGHTDQLQQIDYQPYTGY